MCARLFPWRTVNHQMSVCITNDRPLDALGVAGGKCADLWQRICMFTCASHHKRVTFPPTVTEDERNVCREKGPKYIEVTSAFFTF